MPGPAGWCRVSDLQRLGCARDQGRSRAPQLYPRRKVRTSHRGEQLRPASGRTVIDGVALRSRAGASAGCRCTASKRGISGAMSYSRMSATVIQSPARCASSSGVSCVVERAQQRHRRALARLERRRARRRARWRRRRPAAPGWRCVSASWPMPRAAASTWAPRRTAASSRADAATAGSDRLASSRTSPSRSFGCSVSISTISSLPRTRPRTASSRKPGSSTPSKRTAATISPERGDVPIDGVEQRPPARDGGGRDEGGAIQQDGSHGI